MTLSIIIVNYKVKKEILRCIDTIYSSKPILAFEIIVVDNDKRVVIEKELEKKFPKVIYIKNKINSGYGAGNNLGAKYAEGEYLFFLNPDTEVLKETIDILFKFISSKKNVGAVSPILLNNRGVPHFVQGSKHHTILNTIFSLSFIHKFFPNNPIAKDFFLSNWNRKSIKEVDIVPGTAFMISKGLLKKVGGFDEKFFLFFEEADLCKRINKLGLKNYIIPDAKLIHFEGRSTKKRNDINEIFNKSKFYYFKKWHGIIPALIVQGFTSISKNHLLLTAILLVGFFLRVFKLSELMTFIGDQGWFYLSARNMLLSGKIPLVGITASHTWLHQGPVWTYILAIIFFIFKFNPVAPAYFTALVGTFIIFLFYKILKEIYSKQAGLIAALLYATSPLIVVNDRFAYHTSLIPLFTLLFIYFFYKWLNGKIIFFPLIILTLSLLYNLELFTSVLWIVLILFVTYGLVKKEVWIIKINKKIIFLSFISFIIPMLPILIYDISHGFRQTIIFPGWIIYKSITFIGSNHLGNIFQLIHYLWINYQDLVYPLSSQISLLLFLGSFGYFLVFLYKTKSYFNNFIAFTFMILVFGVVINRTSSGAYLPAFFPFIILITSIFFTKLSSIKSINFIVFPFFLIIVGFNSMYLVATNFYSNKNFSFKKRIESVDRITNLAENQKYNILGRGEGSQFESFTMNYEYLLWWKMHPASNKSQKVKIIISEDNNGIYIDNGNQ